MAKNYFNSIRKSYFTSTLLTSILSNVMVFGQPLRQMEMDIHKLEEIADYAPNFFKAKKKIIEIDIDSVNNPSKVFYANEGEGVIGQMSNKDIENPFDNFFSVNLPKTINLEKFTAVLSYNLYGLTEASQTTKGINNLPSYGGRLIKKNNQWNKVEEVISTKQLRLGTNQIFFTRRKDEYYQYKIKNLKIELIEKENESAKFSEAVLTNYQGNVYALGTVYDETIKKVKIEGKEFIVNNGIFEGIVNGVEKYRRRLYLNYLDSNQMEHTLSVPVKYVEKVAQEFENNERVKTFESYVWGKSDLSKVQFNSVSISKTAGQVYLPESGVNIRGLMYKDIKPTNLELKNVTAGNFMGYHVEKINSTDSVPLQLHLKYNPEKIPEGYTAKDVKTFYFDQTQKSWKSIPTDSLDYENKEIISTISHETDFINGVIKVPESPETGSFAPTTMNNIKYADPGSQVVSIQPPSPNSKGTVTTGFPIKLPKGRNGMQPSLQISYNSEAGNGWMGIGWNINTPAITLNTKWGAPRFDSENETEQYSLNGSDLLIGLCPSCPEELYYASPNRQNSSRIAEAQFYHRKEGNFEKIIRHGNSPKNYWWEVIDKQGNKNYYGGYGGSLLPSTVVRDENGNISNWALYRTEDPYGNYIEYSYNQTVVNVEGTGIQATEFYLNEIEYTRQQGISNYYKVEFKRNSYNVGENTSFIERKDKILSARNGVLQLTEDLLTEIKVSMKQGAQIHPIRTYRFDYYEKAFKKQHLKKISEFDTEGKLFYTNTMEYFNANDNNLYETGSITWGGNDDDIGIPLLEEVIGASPLGSSKSSGFSGSLRGGIGLGSNILSKQKSIGGNIGWARNTQKGEIVFIDINGDGLPDKVFKEGGNIYYRPNKSGAEGEGNNFGNVISISGISELSETISRTLSGGLDVTFYLTAGVNWSKTRSDTDGYFIDRNGDGLVDLVQNGRIRFNSTNGTNPMDRVFGTSVDDTENKIIAGAMNADVAEDIEFPSLDEVYEENPQFDVVTTWEAPYNGTIDITGQAVVTANTMDDEGNYINKFGFTIERKNNQGTDEIINNVTRNGSGSVNINKYNVGVEKGDILFFRSHNYKYGSGGSATWSPQIQYDEFTDPYSGVINPDLDFVDENGKQLKNYNSTDDFILTNGAGFQEGFLSGNSSAYYAISENLSANYLNTLSLTDVVHFKVKKIRYYTFIPSSANDTPTEQEEIALQPDVISTNVTTFNPSTGNFIGSLPGSITAYKGINQAGNEYKDVIYFSVESESNIKWNEVTWQPILLSGGENYYPQVNHVIYNDNLNQVPYKLTDLPIPNIITNPSNPIYNDGDNILLNITHNLEEVMEEIENSSSSSISIVRDLVLSEINSGASRDIYLVVKGTINGEVEVVSKRKMHVNANFELYGEQSFISLSKNKIDELSNLYVSFYVPNRLLANLLSDAHEDNFSSVPEPFIKLALTEDEADEQNWNPITLTNPFFTTKSNSFGSYYRGWGRFLYNGGIYFHRNNEGEVILNNGNPETDYFGDTQGSIVPIDTEIFAQSDDEQINGDLENLDANTGVDDIGNTSKVVRYNLFKQNNEEKKYENEGVLAEYKLNANNKLEFDLARFGDNNLFDVYVDPDDIISTDNSNGEFLAIRQYSVSKGVSESLGGSYGNFSGTLTNSDADSKVLNQYIDLNGDRYPDIVTNNKKQYTNSLGALSGEAYSNDFLVRSESNDKYLGASSGLVPNSTEVDNVKTNGNQTNTQKDAGAGITIGNTEDKQIWIDINGDGLPDKIRIDDGDVKVNLNMGYGFSQQITWGNGLYSTKTSERISENLSGGYGAGANFSSNSAGSYAFGASVKMSTADMKRSFVDITGDGLPDLITPSGYYLNTGTKFDNSLTTLSNGSLSINIATKDKSYAVSSYGTGTAGITFPTFIGMVKLIGTGSLNVNAGLNRKSISFQDINGDGFPDILERVNNNDTKINAKLSKIGKTHLLKKVNTPLGGSWEVEYTRKGNTYEMPQSKWVMSKVKTDDGFTDDNNYAPDKTLTTVNYSDPHYDRRERDFFGFAELTIEQRNPGNEDLFRYTIKKYHNDNYYLAGIEKSEELYDSSSELLSKKETIYNLLDPNNPLVNTEEDGYIQNISNPFVDIPLLDYYRLFVAVVKTESTSYEGSTGISSLQKFTKYDKHGNITEYINEGEGGDDTFKSIITYYDDSNISQVENAYGFPRKIQVQQNSTGEVLRERLANYNSKGKLGSIRTKLNINGNFNTVNFEYSNNYGNLTKVIQTNSVNDSGNPYFQEIEYDNVVHTYPITFINAFGEKSITQYEYLFGTPVLVIDMNEQSMRTRIDNRGRIVEYTGPNEMALEADEGSPAWTIRMQYEFNSQSILNNISPTRYMVVAAEGAFEAIEPGGNNPTDSQHYAITRHFDSMYADNNNPTISNNQILSISITDGFNNPLQIKKTLVSGDNDMLKWLVSGKEVKDAFGRTLEKYLPTVQTGYPSDFNSVVGSASYDPSINTEFDSQKFTYDTRNRQLSIRQPDESVATTIEYAIENDRFTQLVTNENGQTQLTYTDVRGRKRKTVQNSEKETLFDYNTINELVKVTEMTDDGNHETNYLYDLAGRNTEVQQPDRGVIMLIYDNAGNLIERKTSNLLISGGPITYEYEYNRLKKINYPLNPTNNITYEYGREGNSVEEHANAVGRVFFQKDGSGIQVFGYGRMGELNRNLRSVAVAGYNSYWFLTRWKYDSWNRVRQIVYPDQDEVNYDYNKAGELNAVHSDLGNMGGYDQKIVGHIEYNDYGERDNIKYGNSVVSTYHYDSRRRMERLLHSFANGFNIEKEYKYDALSNITDIVDIGSSVPSTTGQIGGPSNHHYEYDEYNRLTHAKGNYVGPNDLTTPLLRQEYTLDMIYDISHNIINKTQHQQQGIVSSPTGQITNAQVVEKTSYDLSYEDYGEGNNALGTNSYPYIQPHAPTTIVETPTQGNVSSSDPRVRKKIITYDANGNQELITEKIGDEEIKLRKNLWDEESRLKAVDLNPESNLPHPIAIYSYDVLGERIIKRNVNRLETDSNGKKVSELENEQEDNILIYPNGLLIGSIKPTTHQLNYTKYYYMGSERVGAMVGTAKNLGDYPSKLIETYLYGNHPDKRSQSTSVVNNESALYLQKIYTAFNLTPPVLNPQVEPELQKFDHELSEGTETFYFHPDHLGSSNYITNLAGNICQHMEYLPFGETLVEEHVNSNNSPFKFNGKELDEETGNYYYGARYYNPKWSVWLSVDPASEMYPGVSPYAYTLQNPVRFVDPTGMFVENPVYDSQGNYRGDTEEGFTGEAIIYDGDKDFSNMSKDELVNDNGGTYLSNEGFNSSHPSSRDKIESHIANYNLDDGLNIDGEIKIKHHKVDNGGGLYNAGEGTSENLLVKRGIHKNGSSVSDEYFKPTVENLRNVINIHEVKGHILNDLSGESSDHFRVFEMQINNPQFKSTTNSFKGFHLNHLYNYGNYSGNNILGNSKYKSLYYQYGYPFYKALNKK